MWFWHKIYFICEVIVHRSFCAFKSDGGLSRPVPVQRGIRQGCPLSGMFYTLAIEPLLNKLSKELSGLTFSGEAQPTFNLSAYADDITVFLISPEDFKALSHNLKMHHQPEWPGVSVKDMR